MSEHIPPINGKDFGAYVVQFRCFNECMDLCGYPTKDPQNPRKIEEPRQRRDSG